MGATKGRCDASRNDAHGVYPVNSGSKIMVDFSASLPAQGLTQGGI